MHSRPFRAGFAAFGSEPGTISASIDLETVFRREQSPAELKDQESSPSKAMNDAIRGVISEEKGLSNHSPEDIFPELSLPPVSSKKRRNGSVSFKRTSLSLFSELHSLSLAANFMS